MPEERIILSDKAYAIFQDGRVWITVAGNPVDARITLSKYKINELRELFGPTNNKKVIDFYHKAVRLFRSLSLQKSVQPIAMRGNIHQSKRSLAKNTFT